MSVSVIQMLLLGGVALFEPVNGYQIRRELLSWQVDEWAHINPGSIYHGLGALTRQGHLVRHDLLVAGREVAVYELTESGRTELQRLIVEGLEVVDPHDRTPFVAAFGLVPLLDRGQVRRSLTRRRVALEQAVADLASPDPTAAPPHALRGRVLWLDLAVAELGWLRETIEEVRAGRLVGSGQGPTSLDGWTPPAEDAGWQMAAEREKYRSLLGR